MNNFGDTFPPIPADYRVLGVQKQSQGLIFDVMTVRMTLFVYILLALQPFRVAGITQLIEKCLHRKVVDSCAGF